MASGIVDHRKKHILVVINIILKLAKWDIPVKKQLIFTSLHFLSSFGYISLALSLIHIPSFVLNDQNIDLMLFDNLTHHTMRLSTVHTVM